MIDTRLVQARETFSGKTFVRSVESDVFLSGFSGIMIFDFIAHACPGFRHDAYIQVIRNEGPGSYPMLRLLPILLLLFFSSPAPAADETHDVPREIGGFKLGVNLSDYKDQVLPDTALPLRHSEFLSEVDVKPPDGYKSGYITYGTCEQAEKVLRIKLKYEREDREFFNELMERFNKKFGKPAEYKGDAFRACLAWKWNFVTSSGEKINLLLEHKCEQDEDIGAGNSVKLTLRSAIDNERLCFEKKFRQAVKGDNSEEKPKGQPDFKMLVPN